MWWGWGRESFYLPLIPPSINSGENDLEAGKVFGAISMPEVWKFGYKHQCQYFVFLMALVMGFLLYLNFNPFKNTEQDKD